jgi:hypothetical protein
VYTVPASVACVRLRHEPAITSDGHNFPSAPAIVTSFAPPVKNDAAPNSSRSMCASS